MGVGIMLPVQVDRRGTAKTKKGGEYLRQIIFSGLTPNYSRNPFQTGGGVVLGISERIIFANNIESSQMIAKREISNFFQRLKNDGLARLIPGSRGIEMVASGADLEATVRYIDLEGDREQTAEIDIKNSLTTSFSSKVT
jgi:hypothetical protein